jgi:fermentation-respiration switch protein FrsA (DUF1100 family)
MAAFVYLGVVIVFIFLENSLLFHPVRASDDWVAPPSSRIEDVEFSTADGTSIHGWWYRNGSSTSALLYAHGNAGNLSHRGPTIVPMAEALGVSVLIFDYPGYGRSAGKPNEKSCYAAGEAAYDWLTQSQQVAPENVVLFGKSLGGGVMTELASHRPHRALVLVKTFSSVPDMGQELFPWLPARWLVRNRFDSLAKIGQCHRPVFLAHGDCDSVIPCSHSQRLYEAANEPKRFLLMPGCDHNDALGADFLSALRQFLDQFAPVAMLPQAASRAGS